MRIYSFDVFDTVLTRAVGDPAAVFRLVGDRLHASGLIACSAEAFALTRQRADEDIIAHSRRAPTLNAIHDEVARRLGLPPDAAAVVAAVEVDVERTVSRVVPGALDEITRARSNGRGQIVFVSDTPLPAAFLVELLAGAGAWRAGDRIYASAEVGASKYEGNLFDWVRNDLGVQASNLEHTGDDAHSDVRMARSRGWLARQLGAARLNRYEGILERHAPMTDGLTSYMAGASRLARAEAISEHTEAALADVAAGVAAPLLIGYALWMSQQVRRLNLEQLFFVARDGEVLLEVARPVFAAVNLEVECRYLYGSRQAWQFAAAGLDMNFRPGRLLTLDDEPRSARSILDRVHLDLGEAYAATSDPLLAPELADVPLVPARQADVVALLGEEPLRRRLATDAAAQGDLLLEYLQQEGLGTGRRAGFVDIGWLGHMGRAVEDVLAAGDRPPPTAWLYLGLLEKAEQAAGPTMSERQHAFLFDLDRGFGVPQRLFGVQNLLEALCQASHGRTVGYRRSPTGVEPALERSAREEELVAWGLAAYRSVLLRAVALLVRSPDIDLTAHVDLRPALSGVLHELWEHPTAAEAERWGSLPFDVDVAGGSAVPLAAPVALEDVVRELCDRRRVKLRPAGSWRAGVVRRSVWPWRAAFHVAASAEKMLPRLRRILRRVRARPFSITEDGRPGPYSRSVSKVRAVFFSGGQHDDNREAR